MAGQALWWTVVPSNWGQAVTDSTPYQYRGTSATAFRSTPARRLRPNATNARNRNCKRGCGTLLLLVGTWLDHCVFFRKRTLLQTRLVRAKSNHPNDTIFGCRMPRIQFFISLFSDGFKIRYVTFLNFSLKVVARVRIPPCYFFEFIPNEISNSNRQFDVFSGGVRFGSFRRALEQPVPDLLGTSPRRHYLGCRDGGA